MVLKLPSDLAQNIKNAQILICAVVSLPIFENVYDTDQ